MLNPNLIYFVKIKTGKKIGHTGDLMSIEEWKQYRELQKKHRFKSRFKVTNYKPACNPRDMFADFTGDKSNLTKIPVNQVTDMDLESSDNSGNDEEKPRKMSKDLKNLPDIIPKRISEISRERSSRKEKSDSDEKRESPLPNRK